MRNVTILVLCLYLISGCQKSGQSVLLRLNYKKGDDFTITYHTTANSSTNQANEVVKMDFKVDSVVGDSLYILSAKYNYVRVDNGGVGPAEHYASDKDEAEMTAAEKAMHQEFKSVLDSTYTLTINNKGKIKLKYQ